MYKIIAECTATAVIVDKDIGREIEFEYYPLDRQLEVPDLNEDTIKNDLLQHEQDNLLTKNCDWELITEKYNREFGESKKPYEVNFEIARMYIDDVDYELDED